MLIVPQSPIDIVETNVPEYETNIDIYIPENNKVYNKDDETQYGDTIYKCMKDGTTGIEPGTNSLIWYPQSKTNRHRIFDAKMSSGTSNLNSIQYKFNVGDVDTVAFFGLVAQSVRVIIRSADTTVMYDRTIQTHTRYAANWYDWTYVKAQQKKAIHFLNMPMIYNATMEVIIDNGQSIAECSHLAFGTSRDFGITLREPAPIVSVRNIIPKTKNEKGVIITDNSMTYKRIVANVLLKNQNLDEIIEQIKLLNAEAMLFLADEREEGFASLLEFGYFKDFDMPIGLETTVYQIEIEGVV